MLLRRKVNMTSHIGLMRILSFAVIQFTLTSSQKTRTWTFHSDINFSANAVLPGDNFNATCTISTKRNYPDYMPVRWTREDCHGNKEVLATDDMLDAKLRADDRYRVSMKALNEHNTSHAFFLSINDIKLTETGTYGCVYTLNDRRRVNKTGSMGDLKLLSAALFSQKLKVVLQTISSFNGSVQNLTDGQNLILDNGHEQKFNCLVIGGATEVEIYHHEKNTSGQDVSIKRSFKWKQHPEFPNCKQTSEGVVYTEPVTQIYEKGAVKMEDWWNGKQLMCVAKRYVKHTSGKVAQNVIVKSSVTLLMKGPTGATDTGFKPIWTFYMCVLIVQLLPLF